MCLEHLFNESNQACTWGNIHRANPMLTYLYYILRWSLETTNTCLWQVIAFDFVVCYPLSPVRFSFCSQVTVTRHYLVPSTKSSSSPLHKQLHELQQQPIQRQLLQAALSLLNQQSKPLGQSRAHRLNPLIPCYRIPRQTSLPASPLSLHHS